ncbi:MAG: PrsW family glutamic-type intramembrane protease [Planctomycetota bacterium]
MGLIGALIVGFVPALLWLWVFWRKDRWEREPKRLVLRVFLFGAVMAGPIFVLERHLPLPPTIFAEFFVRVGFVEELFKILPVLYLALRHAEFDEPMDGVVYGAAAALGFAGAENAVYAIHAGGATAIVRAFTSTVLHVGLTGMVGYAIGLARFGRAYRGVIALSAFLAAVTIHGSYNFFLAVGTLPEAPDWIARFAVATMIPAMLVLLAYAIRRADKLSPHRRVVVPVLTEEAESGLLREEERERQRCE